MQVSNIIAHHKQVEMLQHGRMCSPVFADLHLSNICNQKCLGCAYTDKHGIGTVYMSTHDILKTIDTLSGEGVKAFDFVGGGESLCIPDIGKAFSRVVNHNKSYALITNGLLFHGKIMKQIVCEATYVRVSLEGATALDYATYKQTTRGQQEQVIGYIKAAISHRDKVGSTCEISIKFSVGKSLRGTGHYMAGIELGRSLGVDSIQFKALRHEPEELNYDDKVIENRLLRQAIYESGADDLVRYWIVPESHIPQCYLNPLHVVVDHNGDMYLCCFYYYRGNEHKIGNIITDNFSDVWYGAKHAEKVKAIDKNQCEFVDCKFFKHHAVADWAFDRNRTHWL